MGLFFYRKERKEHRGKRDIPDNENKALRG
jgi:hypothetical protein